MVSSRRLAASLITALALSATIVSARAAIVRSVPQSAVLFAAVGLPVNLDGLEIGSVQASVRFENDLRTLMVESEIVNRQSVARPVPLLRFSIRDADGSTLYTWTAAPGAKTLGPGGRLPVRGRLTAPPAGRDVLVEFVRAPA